MTTVIPFLPSNITPPSFNVTFDGDSYVVRITWNISAQRYYVNVYDISGGWIVTVPLVTTPPSRLIRSAYYDGLQKVVNVTMVDPSLWPVPLSPHGVNIKPGTIIEYTFRGFQPDAYNGKFRCLHITETNLTFPMEADPGPVTVLGFVDRALNMIAGVFVTSSLIYRNGSFEIDP